MVYICLQSLLLLFQAGSTYEDSSKIYSVLHPDSVTKTPVTCTSARLQAGITHLVCFPSPVPSAMMASQADLAKGMYDKRASTYDQSFHPKQTEDYVRWAALKPGQHLLDLCCGTGLVTIAAARDVSPSGSATGVDVSDGMLAVARQKAEAEKLPITWILHDVVQLDGVDLRREGYDVITAAACLPLFPDPEAVVSHWVKLLAPGGRLIFDALNDTTHIPGILYERVTLEVGGKMPFTRGWITGLPAVEALARNAGLEIERSFVASGYGLSQTYKVDDAAGIFDGLANGTFKDTLPTPELARMAKGFFVERFHALADSDGLVKEDEGFYMVFAKRA